jgi:integrase/recombinase XerD
MSEFKQLSMFGDQPRSAQPPEDAGEPLLTTETPFNKAVEIYLVALRLSGASQHTIKAFRSDLRLLGDWLKSDHPVGEFSTPELNRFLHWMLTERGKPCSPKTYARRVTTLKNFFSYLQAENAVRADPAAAIIQKPVSSPLPAVLSEGSLVKVFKVTEEMRTNPEKPDARPHMLVTLLLQTAIKKSECVAIRHTDIDRTSLDTPFLWVRYANPRLRYKERKIQLHTEWLLIYDEYVKQRQLKDLLFDCTPRNLEYILRDVANSANVERRQMSFEALRWTAALRDYLDNMEHDKLRQKLGLSRISWRETSSKLQRLAEEYDRAVESTEESDLN